MPTPLCSSNNLYWTVPTDQLQPVTFPQNMYTPVAPVTFGGVQPTRVTIPPNNIIAGEHESVASAFTGAGIVPDLLPVAPLARADIQFPSGASVNLGNEIEARLTTNLPEQISWLVEPGALYTIFMTGRTQDEGGMDRCVSAVQTRRAQSVAKSGCTGWLSTCRARM